MTYVCCANMIPLEEYVCGQPFPIHSQFFLKGNYYSAMDYWLYRKFNRMLVD